MVLIIWRRIRALCRGRIFVLLIGGWWTMPILLGRFLGESTLNEVKKDPRVIEILAVVRGVKKASRPTIVAPGECGKEKKKTKIWCRTLGFRFNTKLTVRYRSLGHSLYRFYFLFDIRVSLTAQVSSVLNARSL
ncbi:hypothetical protein BJX63DRAFT_413907 [Aspergillus granulosus]|uniref:Uncharacterized protein n=1 Tax=Aspergillus granulosus TaxID=176169 RepID=A0ABR4GUR7_9EURO